MIACALICAVHLATVSPDSQYSSTALARLVAFVARENRRVPSELMGYTATIESEMALLLNTPTASDGAVARTPATTAEASVEVEQVQVQAAWQRTGTFQEKVVGYRARQIGPMVSAMNMLPRPWTAPTLYGDRMSQIFGGPPSLRTPDSTRRDLPAIHPFSDERDASYRFTGGDTIATIRLGRRDLTIVHIHIEPVNGRSRAMLFAGDVYVDSETGSIMRMRGRITLVAPRGEFVGTKILRRVGQVEEVAYIDFENDVFNGHVWLPHRQRLEYQVSTGLTESRATIRVQSVWKNMVVSLPGGVTVSSADTLGKPVYSLVMSSPDSTSKWTAWASDLGTVTGASSSRDFEDVAPPGLRPTGPPILRWQARGFSDVVRVNRVEGLYVGSAAMLDLREAAPGFSVRTFGGIALLPKTPKGGVEATLIHDGWIGSAVASRQLASTNDFSSTFGAQGNAIASLFGHEDFDWVDRYLYSLSLIRELGSSHSSSVRAEIARGHDAGFTQQLTTGPIGGDFRPNRPVTPGEYVRSRLQLDLGRNIVTNPLATGVGTMMSYERGDGSLSWQRAQAQALAQRAYGRFELAARADGAVVIGSNLPVQQLLEIGGIEGLPGYDYKAFSGDRAIVTRATVAYRLPFLELPLQAGGVILPAVSPRLQVGLFGGQASSSSATTSALLDRLGWVSSDGWKGSLDVRVLLFGGAIGIGASRPVDQRRAWRGEIRLGGAP